MEETLHDLFHIQIDIEPQPQVNPSHQDRGGRVCFHKPNYFYIQGSTWISDKLIRSLDTLLTILRSLWHVYVYRYKWIEPAEPRLPLFHFLSIPIMRQICFTSLPLRAFIYHISLSLYFSPSLSLHPNHYCLQTRSLLKDCGDRVTKEGYAHLYKCAQCAGTVRGFTGWRSTWPLSTTNYQWPRTLAIWSEVCRGAEVLVRRVVSRSFWGWTRGIRPVSQSVTMHPGREIVPERGDTVFRGWRMRQSKIGHPRGP